MNQYQPPPPGHHWGPPPQPVYYQRPPAPPSVTKHGPEIMLTSMAWLFFCITVLILPPLGLILLGLAIWSTIRSVNERQRREAARLAWRRQTWGY